MEDRHGNRGYVPHTYLKTYPHATAAAAGLNPEGEATGDDGGGGGGGADGAGEDAAVAEGPPGADETDTVTRRDVAEVT